MQLPQAAATHCVDNDIITGCRELHGAWALTVSCRPNPFFKSTPRWLFNVTKVLAS